MTNPRDDPSASPPDSSVVGSPVRWLPEDDTTETALKPGVALCLSGGGYRAMVFHIGVLWRLNEAGVLHDLKRISSVSGGSVTAGVLAMNWSRLGFDENNVAADFVPQVVQPIRAMANESIDISSVLTGLLSPFSTISERVIRAYSEHLFGTTSLHELPDNPRFVFNATNLESGALMRFSKPYIADYRVGRIMEPVFPLAIAVAASSAFPPFLSPCTVDLSGREWTTDPGNDLANTQFRGAISLSDGGVYDNLGIETAWKQYETILVSDAGGHMGADATPPADWGRHMLRVLNVIDNQVRSLRKQQVIESLKSGKRTGMYVGIRSDINDFPVKDPIAAEPALTHQLAAIATRLNAMNAEQQELLINWGYAICDAGLRSHVMDQLPAGSLPYPDHPLTGGDSQ